MAKPEYDFKVSTPEASQLRVLSELLKSNLEQANFIFRHDGIYLRECNASETVLFDVHIRGDAIEYQPPAQEMCIGFTCEHLYKMLKGIKRKDKLVFYREKGSDHLVFHVINAEKGREKDNAIRIKEVPRHEWALPKHSPTANVTIPAPEFQRMCKEMASNCSHVVARFQKRGIFFSGAPAQLYIITEKHGEWKEDESELFTKTFPAKQLDKLAKCSGLGSGTSNNLHVSYVGKDDQIKFVSAIGSIGTLHVYIDEGNDERDAAAPVPKKKGARDH